MYVIRKKIYVTKEQRHEFNEMFFIAYKVYIVCVKYAKKQYKLLKSNKRYSYPLHLYKKYKTENKEFPYKEELNNLIKEYKLTKTDLEKYLKMQKYSILTSTQIQCIADNVSKAVDKCLYSNGKDMHIKKFNEFNEIKQKSFNGFKYNGYDLNFKNELYKLKYDITYYFIFCFLKNLNVSSSPFSANILSKNSIFFLYDGFIAFPSVPILLLK